MFPKLNAFLHRRSILSGHSSQSPSGRLLFIVAQHTTHEKTFNGQQKGETRKKRAYKSVSDGRAMGKNKERKTQRSMKGFLVFLFLLEIAFLLPSLTALAGATTTRASRV